MYYISFEPKWALKRASCSTFRAVCTLLVVSTHSLKGECNTWCHRKPTTYLHGVFLLLPPHNYYSFSSFILSLFLLTTSRVYTARNVEQLAFFRATLSLKRDVVHGVTANSLPGYSTMQTFKSYLTNKCKATNSNVQNEYRLWRSGEYTLAWTLNKVVTTWMYACCFISL